MSVDAAPLRVVGPEPGATMAGRVWSWWDLWFCVIAVQDHDGVLGVMAAELATRIRANKRARVHFGDSDDARLSHLFDLAERLGVAGLRPADLAGPAVRADRKTTARARAKLKGRIPEGAYARTTAMRDLPRERLLRRARHGRWSMFPTGPTAFYDLFRPTVDRTGWVPELQTGRLVRTLETRLTGLDGPRRAPRRTAVAVPGVLHRGGRACRHRRWQLRLPG